MARGIRRTGAAGQPPLPRALTWLDLGYLASGPGTSALPVPTGMRYGSHMPNKEDLYDAAVDLFGDGKLEEAVARYEEALALDPGYVDAWHGLAMAYNELGRHRDRKSTRLNSSHDQI